MIGARHLAEYEYGEFRSWLLEPTRPVEFRDSANRRLADVLTARTEDRATPLELAVMLRQHLRRWSLARGRNQALETRGVVSLLTDDAIASTGLSVIADGDRHVLSAREWAPDWLDVAPGASVDESAAAGTTVGYRRRPGQFASDPIFKVATGHSQYLTPGQRAAVRMVLEMEPAAVMIGNLPTGSGKTEIAVTLARSFAGERGAAGGTTVMVVPTIALAQDLETRLRSYWTRAGGRGDMSKVPFAWTSETPERQRRQLDERITDGKQPIIVTSPESIAGALLQTIRTAAGNGRLRALVVDEAHLITQWGRSFRPEFRLLGDLWRELNTSSELGIRAVLLSATLSADVVADLMDLFHSDAGTYITAANTIRSEPSFWVAGMAPSFEEREKRVMEALAHLPRPSILYVTQPKIAQRWIRQLQEAGYRRIIDVTGETEASDRMDALAGLRTSEVRSKYDVVVGTSAFGLGIDVDEIRTVIHACLPETADRWYQEVGRGGRDAYASTALLVPSLGDKDEAMSLGVRVLTPEVARAHWDAMWKNRQDVGSDYVNLGEPPIGTFDGSYNRRWNAQILDGLSDLGVLSRRVASKDEALGLGLPVERSHARSLAPAWQRIRLRKSAPDERFFDGAWTQWKADLESRSYANLSALERLIESQNACETIEVAYRPSPDLVRRLGADTARGFGVPTPCGRCQACRRAGRDDDLDPAPEPSLRWIESGTRSPFDDFVDANVFGGDTRFGPVARTTVIEADGDETEKLVKTLIGAGVLLGSGRSLQPFRESFRYFDDEPDPIFMPPLPALVACEPSDSLSDLLGALHLRQTSCHGAVGATVVQVSKVPRDLRVRRTLTIEDVLSCLEHGR